MQLNLFGEEEPAPETVAVDEYALEDIQDLEFGPVTRIEALTGNSFLSLMPDSVRHGRDTFQSMARKERLDAIMKETLVDKVMHAHAIDGRTSQVQDRFIPMIMDRLNGATYQELADSYCKSYQAVIALFSKPSTRAFIAKLLTEYASGLGDVTEKIKHTAHEAVDTVVDIMRNGKEENRQKSAFALLRMAGHDNTTAIASLTINQQPLDNGIVETQNKLLAALQEAQKSRTIGYEQYTSVGQSRGEDAKQIAVVPAPVGLKKVAGAS